LLNPEKKLNKVEVHQTKREIKEHIATARSIERDVRELLSRKVSSSYLGLWLLIPEHLRLGSWDLIKHWTGEYDTDINPRLALQMVHEAALCVNGIRRLRTLCHQGFDLLNGLPFIATDKSIHYLLGEHTLAEAQSLQVSLAKLRAAKGHYNSGLFALDPHRIGSYSQRIMPAKKSNRKSKSKKIMQTFFCIDALSGQPLAFTIGSSACTTSKATIELLKLMKSIISSKGLVMADTEHATAEILKAFYRDKQFDILIPMPKTQNMKKIMHGLEYQRKWAGYALAETTYTMRGVNFPIELITQRTAEIADEYQYKPFATSSISDSIKMLTEDYPERWTIEEFFNFEAAMGWDRVSTMNLNIRYGKMSLALIAQAISHELRKKLHKPYKNWTAKHLADSLFRGIEGDIRVKNDTIIVTYYNFPKALNLQRHYEDLPKKLMSEGVDPRIPWLYNFKVDFRFK
jgi:hypothetical protein